MFFSELNENMVSLLHQIKIDIKRICVNTSTKPLQCGASVLRQEAIELPTRLINTEEFKMLCKHMQNVMSKYQGQGLAAPQIGLNLQVITVQFTQFDMDMALQKYSEKGAKQREMKLIPFQVLINPKIQITDFNQVTFEEGCLSLERVIGFVPRYQGIEVEALNGDGLKVKFRAEGWYARILQHEVHHLKGLLISDCFVKKKSIFS